MEAHMGRIKKFLSAQPAQIPKQVTRRKPPSPPLPRPIPQLLRPVIGQIIDGVVIHHEVLQHTDVNLAPQFRGQQRRIVGGPKHSWHPHACNQHLCKTQESP